MNPPTLPAIAPAWADTKLYRTAVTTIHTTWLQKLQSYLDSETFGATCNKMEEVDEAMLCPKLANIFKSLSYDMHHTKVLMFMQYPRSEPTWATGLWSGDNLSDYQALYGHVYRDLHSKPIDSNTPMPDDNWLARMAQEQGVLPMTTVWTCVEDDWLAHDSFGWRRFTAEVIKVAAREVAGCDFMFFGTEIHKFQGAIKQEDYKDSDGRERVLVHLLPGLYQTGQDPHAVYQLRPFSRANKFLLWRDRTRVNWMVLLDGVGAW